MNLTKAPASSPFVRGLQLAGLLISGSLMAHADTTSYSASFNFNHSGSISTGAVALIEVYMVN